MVCGRARHADANPSIDAWKPDRLKSGFVVNANILHLAHTAGSKSFFVLSPRDRGYEFSIYGQRGNAFTQSTDSIAFVTFVKQRIQ